MQKQDKLKEKKAKKYMNAASNEITRNVVAGNFKFKRLDKVLAEPNLKQNIESKNRASMSHRAQQIVDMVLNSDHVGF